MYYSEIVKIIDAGLNKDSDRVRNYAKLLASKLREEGEDRASKRIVSLIEKNEQSSVVKDALMSQPVDQESRLSIIDVSYHQNDDTKLVLSDAVKSKVDDFQDTIHMKERMDEIGLDLNMSLLLYGDPGCGKTSVAQYIANQLDLPLITARLDTLVSSLLGNTAKNIRRIFDYARKQPCVLFLDEFDAIAKARDDKHEMGELKRVVNSLLQNIDEFCQDGILIAATNHHELLDSAIWRRFQSIIEIPKPGETEISKFLDTIIGDIPNDFMNDSKRIHNISNAFVGMTYADIKRVLQNAIKKYLLKNEDSLKFIDVIAEIYLFENHGDYSQGSMIQFICNAGIAQSSVAKYFDVSVRQIRNSLERLVVSDG